MSTCSRHGFALVAALVLTAGSAMGVVIGGGVIADLEPSNNTVLGAATFLDALQSGAIIGIASLASDSFDHFGAVLPDNGVLTVMTVPLGSGPSPLSSPNTTLKVTNFDGSSEYVINDDAGTDQSGSNPNGVGSVARCSFTSAGKYVFRVSGSVLGGTGQYAVLASVYMPGAQDWQEQEANNGPAVAVPLGLSLGGPTIGTGNLSPGGDVDHYSVEMRRGDILAAVTTPLGGYPQTLNTPDTVLEIVGTNGATVLCSNDDAGTDQTDGNTRGSAVRFRAPADGKYFIKVRGFNISATGLYSLTAAVIPPPAGTDCAADLNGDGQINTQDLVQFLNVFGNVCP